jgi:hypothetical protein
MTGPHTALTDELQRFSIYKEARKGDSSRVSTLYVRCRDCTTTWHINCSKKLPSEVIVKKARQAGWHIQEGKAPRCPVHALNPLKPVIEQPKPKEAPTTMAKATPSIPRVVTTNAANDSGGVLEHITPLKAKGMLDANTRNRKINHLAVTEYAASMRDKSWRVNGETLKVATDGTLIDGQHRLLACVEANTPFETYVVYGLNKDVFDTIDCGRKRTAADCLSIDGVANASATASAIRWIAALKGGRALAVRGMKMHSDEIRLAYAADSKRISEAVTITNGVSRGWMSPGQAAALYYLFAQKHEAKAKEFFELLGSGAGLHASHPILVLRDRFMRLNQTRGRDIDIEKACIAIRAWNAFRANENVAMLRGLQRNAKGEESMPSIK